MLDGVARKVIDSPLNWLARRLAALGLRANTVTVTGFALGLLACIGIVLGWFAVALALIAMNRLADGLDGAIARQTGGTDLGGFLDIVLDTLFYSAVPFAFALYRQEYALTAAFLIFSFAGTGGSFLAFAVIAAKRNFSTTRSGRKSFFYSTGLMEGTETILFFVLFCVYPDSFVPLAWAFGILCWLTTFARIGLAVREFR